MNYAPLLLPLGLALTAVAVVVLIAALQLSLKRLENARSSLEQPLIGGSGKYLWDRLRSQKLTRNDVYITNVCKRKLVSAAEGYALSDTQVKDYTY